MHARMHHTLLTVATASCLQLLWFLLCAPAPNVTVWYSQHAHQFCRAVENAADDPTLHNPLQRMERLGTGWFGVIAEYEGVVVEDTLEAHKRAWQMVAEEMQLQRPLGQTMQRVKGMRDEVVSACSCCMRGSFAAWP